MGFYTALGYKVVGRVHLDDDVTLTVLKVSDEPVVLPVGVPAPSGGLGELAEDLQVALHMGGYAWAADFDDDQIGRAHV